MGLRKEQMRKKALRDEYERKKREAALAAGATTPSTTQSSANSSNFPPENPNEPASLAAENTGPVRLLQDEQVGSSSSFRSGTPVFATRDFNASFSSVLGNLDLNTFNTSGGSIAQRKRPNPSDVFPTSKFARSGTISYANESMDLDEPIGPPPGFDSVPPGFTSLQTTSTNDLVTDAESENMDVKETSKRRGRPPKKGGARQGGGRPRKSAGGSNSRPASAMSTSSVETIEPIVNANELLLAEEQREKEAEEIANQLNEVQFRVPDLPVRRSVRTTKAPTRYTDLPPNASDTSFAKITDNCRHQQHKGVGCAAHEADHFPDYYDSAAIVEKCPHPSCGGSLGLSHELDWVKCCNKGAVDLSSYLEKLQMQPVELEALKDARFNEKKTEHFLKNVWRYNCEMSFGTLVLEKETVPFGMQVAKVNGNIKYRLSDLHFPQQHTGNTGDFKRKWGQCYTITPDDAIRERIAQLEEKSPLKTEIIATLHRMLDQHHVLAAAYKKCAEFYAERKTYCDQNGIDMPQFRMTLMNKRKAVEQGANIQEGIHDHRLLLPTNEGLMQCATVRIS